MASHVRMRLSGELQQLTRANIIRELETALKTILSTDCKPSVEILGTQESKIEFVGSGESVRGNAHLKLSWEDGVVSEVAAIVF
jgi:hypothetical protein